MTTLSSCDNKFIEELAMSTIKKVAEHAGVSFKTVSRVINNSPNVSEATRNKVLQAMDELDYRPNIAARSMRTGNTRTIGFITDEIATQPHAGNIIRGAQRAAWQRDHVLLIVNTESNPDLEQHAIDMMFERRVDAIIYAAWYHQVVQPPRELYDIPAVLVDCFVDDFSLSSVVPDEIRGGRDATELLLSKGHRRVGFINNEHDIPAKVGRLAGYKEALQNYDIPFEPSLVVQAKSDSSDGYDKVNVLLDLPDPPTGVFCFNDSVAMGAYDAIKERGLRTPDDIAIVGFDNLEVIAAHLYPKLTTLQLPHFEMGKWAIDYLLDEKHDLHRLPNIQHKIECPLILRDSV